MKNTTKQKQGRNCPSEKTRWAYWMQAIEPNSEAINKAFPDYHPQWVQHSQKITIAPASFKYIRSIMGLNTAQCAAFLRVSAKTILKWEKGQAAVSFAAFELLRVVYESVNFRISHPEWDGWFIGESGALNSPDIGGNGFTPEQLNWSTMTRNEAALLRNEIVQVKTELDEARAENTQLRQMFVAQGVVDELAIMQNTISDLMARIATAKVIPFPSATNQLLEKTA
jgi:DNA-binding transcriptional regulator YiaG